MVQTCQARYEEFCRRKLEELPHPLNKFRPVTRELEDSGSGFEEKLSPLGGRM